MPPIGSLRIAVSGQDYPSADGLNNVTLSEMKNYVEQIEKVKVGCPLADYGSYRFYTVFDYTGHQNLFIVPTLSVDVGERVSSRFI